MRYVKGDKMKIDFDSIKILIDEINDLQKYVIKDLEFEINYIINKKIIDDDRIAKLFDSLLNLLQTDEVLILFKKLGRYYYYVNPYLVCDYVNLYREMYLDNNDKMLKL